MIDNVGDVSLPSSQMMENTIDETLNALKKSLYHSPRHTIEVRTLL